MDSEDVTILEAESLSSCTILVFVEKSVLEVLRANGIDSVGSKSMGKVFSNVVIVVSMVTNKA